MSSASAQKCGGVQRKTSPKRTSAARPRWPVATAQPTSGGTAPAAPPLTMFRAGERAGGARQEEQAHDPRLGEREVVARARAGGGRAFERADGGPGRRRERERRKGDVQRPRHHRRRDAEEEKRCDARRQEPPVGEPRRDDERRERRHGERRERSMGRVEARGPADHREERRGRRGERGQPQPEARSGRVRHRTSASRRRRSRKGRALVTYGTRSKFHAGGGEDAYHSSVSASHGSLPTRRPVRAVFTTLTKKSSSPTARIPAPIDDIRLYASQRPWCSYV